jgi:hypothetical protein
MTSGEARSLPPKTRIPSKGPIPKGKRRVGMKMARDSFAILRIRRNLGQSVVFATLGLAAGAQAAQTVSLYDQIVARQDEFRSSADNSQMFLSLLDQAQKSSDALESGRYDLNETTRLRLQNNEIASLYNADIGGFRGQHDSITRRSSLLGVDARLARLLRKLNMSEKQIHDFLQALRGRKLAPEEQARQTAELLTRLDKIEKQPADASLSDKRAALEGLRQSFTEIRSSSDSGQEHFSSVFGALDSVASSDASLQNFMQHSGSESALPGAELATGPEIDLSSALASLQLPAANEDYASIFREDFEAESGEDAEFTDPLIEQAEISQSDAWAPKVAAVGPADGPIVQGGAYRAAPSAAEVAPLIDASTGTGSGRSLNPSAEPAPVVSDLGHDDGSSASRGRVTATPTTASFQAPASSAVTPSPITQNTTPNNIPSGLSAESAKNQAQEAATKDYAKTIAKAQNGNLDAESLKKESDRIVAGFKQVEEENAAFDQQLESYLKDGSLPSGSHDGTTAYRMPASGGGSAGGSEIAGRVEQPAQPAAKPFTSDRCGPADFEPSKLKRVASNYLKENSEVFKSANFLNLRNLPSQKDGGSALTEAQLQTERDLIASVMVREMRRYGICRMPREEKDAQASFESRALFTAATSNAYMHFLGTVNAGSWKPDPTTGCVKIPPGGSDVARQLVLLWGEMVHVDLWASEAAGKTLGESRNQHSCRDKGGLTSSVEQFQCYLNVVSNRQGAQGLAKDSHSRFDPWYHQLHSCVGENELGRMVVLQERASRTLMEVGGCSTNEARILDAESTSAGPLLSVRRHFEAGSGSGDLKSALQPDLKSFAAANVDPVAIQACKKDIRHPTVHPALAGLFMNPGSKLQLQPVLSLEDESTVQRQTASARSRNPHDPPAMEQMELDLDSAVDGMKGVGRCFGSAAIGGGLLNCGDK